MTDHIDVTEDRNGASTYVNKDETSKKRVVALAEGLHDRLRVADDPARKRVRTGVDCIQLPAPAADGEMLQGFPLSTFGTVRPAAAQLTAPLPARPAPQEAVQPFNQVLGQLHAERLARLTEERKSALRSPGKTETVKPSGSSVQPGQQAATAHATSTAPAPARAQRVTVLSYNLWFNEDVALLERMRAVGGFIREAKYPDFLLLQEVTANIVKIFEASDWFLYYQHSNIPKDKAYFTLLLARRDTVTLPAMRQFRETEYDNTRMSRSILYTRAIVNGRPLTVGTTHLESPVGPGQLQMVAQRKEQLEVAVRELEAAAGIWGDVLLAGDLNWNDDRDGPMQLPPRWCDAWRTLQPNSRGYTYDPKSNPMLTSRYKPSRLDRVLCRLSASTETAVGGPSALLAGGPSGSHGGGCGGGWQLSNIRMIGMEALPKVTYDNNGRRLPVLPSDHFGLLVTLVPAETPRVATVGGVLGNAAESATEGRNAVNDVTQVGSGRIVAPGVAGAAAALPAAGREAAAGCKAGNGSPRLRRRLPRTAGGDAVATGLAAATAAPTRGPSSAPTGRAAAAAGAQKSVRNTAKNANGPKGGKAASAAPHSDQNRETLAVDLTVDDDDDDDDDVTMLC